MSPAALPTHAFSSAHGHPPPIPRPPPPPYTFNYVGGSVNVPFCSDHWCGKRSECCPQTCAVVEGASAHIGFVHVEKTGGSSIECATQWWQYHGFWDNLGHQSEDGDSATTNIEGCMSRCQAGIATAVVAATRDPYLYWASVYRYAWQSVGLHDSSEWAKLEKDLGTVGGKLVLESFDTYMGYVKTFVGDAQEGSYGFEMSLSHRLNKACRGKRLDECRVDFWLRTEQLSDDWAAMLAHYSMPVVALPEDNVSGRSCKDNCTDQAPAGQESCPGELSGMTAYGHSHEYEVSARGWCKNNATWAAAKSCQWECYENGLGYEGDACCPRMGSSPPSTEHDSFTRAVVEADVFDFFGYLRWSADGSSPAQQWADGRPLNGKALGAEAAASATSAAVASFVLSAAIAFAAVVGTKRLVREYRQQWHNAAQANELGEEKDEGYDVGINNAAMAGGATDSVQRPGLGPL